MAHRFLFIVILAVFSRVGVAHGGWSTQFGPTGLTQMGFVTAAVEYEGDLVVAGYFNTAGSDTVNHIARWDGERWHPLGTGLWGVECLAVHEGRLVAGGKFKPEGGVRFHGLSYWDGGSWQRLSDRLEGEVHALVSYRGDLVVGGRFTIHGEIPIHHIARWDGRSWLPLGQGVARGGRTRIEALEVHAGELIVGGVFGQAGQVETFHVARWDGRQWHAFGDGADDAVNALRSSGGHLYAAGTFQMISGDSASCVAEWDGDSWSPLGDGVRTKSPDLPVVNALEIWRGELVVAGKFDTAGGVPAGSIATWDGRNWRSLPPGFHDERRPMNTEEVHDLAIYDGRLVAGGKMKGGTGFLVNHLGLWDGEHWDPLIAGQGIESGAGNMHHLGGRLLVQGSGAAGAGNLQGPVYWDDGCWRPFESTAEDSSVFQEEHRMLVEHEGRLMAFGKLYATAPRNARQRIEHTWRLAVWDDGWRVVTPPLETKVELLSQAVSVGDDVVVLGSFTGPGSVQEHGVVWDGQRWRALGLGEDFFSISCSAVIDRHLYLAWQAASAGDQPMYSVAEWDGRRWQVIKTGINSAVRAMTGRDGCLVASFDILQQGCTEPGMIQEWDGEAWHPLPGSFSLRYDHDAHVVQLAMYQGCLVAAGDFKCIDGRACQNIAFLDDEVWRPLGSGVKGAVDHLVPTASCLWLSGSFETAGGNLSQHVARWDGPLPVGTPVEPPTECTPEDTPVIRRGDGWHSHSLDMTDPLLPFANGDFLAMTDGLPDRWEWHANSDRYCPQDSISLLVLPAGGVGIRACNEHGAYVSLAQRFSVEGDRFYRVRARYDMSGAPGDSGRLACRISIGDYSCSQGGGEYGSLHTGMWNELENGAQERSEIILRTDPKAGVGVVTFNVRGPGTQLILREVCVDTIQMQEDDITRLLIAELQSEYVPQSGHTIDWHDLEQRYTGKDAGNWRDYGRQVSELLAALEDYRITLEDGRGDCVGIQLLSSGVLVPVEDRLSQERESAIRDRLMDCEEWGGNAATGWTREGIAYLNLQTPSIGREKLAELASAEGILIDLRASAVGSRPEYGSYDRLIDLVGRFAAEPLIVGYSRPNPAGRGVADTLWAQPADELSLGMPVVCLIGQGCGGYGAEFAMMMKDMPNVTLVGRPTRGGSGRLARCVLPIGSQVNYPSRSLWSSDHELIDDSHGVQPDIHVDPDGTLDPVFDKGLQVLLDKISDQGR